MDRIYPKGRKRSQSKRAFYSFLLSLLILTLLVAGAAAQTPRPILFVHGNGDSAALWYTTLWRFESNGYDRSLLYAVDFPHPTARSDDTRPQENRSSTVDQAKELAAEVKEIQSRTGQEKVILVGSSRGGYAIRNYIKNFGGAANVYQAILCGTPNHGTQASPSHLNNEFNGAGPFLSGLNAGEEVYPGVQFLTTRSDSNDKYAQPDGRFLGMPGAPTQVTYAGPELRGAKNVVLPGLDHREVAFHAKAFQVIYEFITGHEPQRLDILPEAQVILNGMISGWASGAPTNLPLAGATIEIFEVNPSSGERTAAQPVHRRTMSADGVWGPFTARAASYYEFVIAAEGYPTTHIYRTPFPRSSPYIHFRLKPRGEREKGSGSLVTLVRPRGYLGHGRDKFMIDGKVPDGVNEGVPGTAEAIRLFEPGIRSVRVVLNQESLTVRTYPRDGGHIVIAEFHY